MWIGLLTAGAHPSRPPATNHLATLFVWGSQTRARIDGPPEAVPAGIRGLRRTARDEVGTPCRPRCFACREPYPLPDAAEIRAQQDIVDLADHDDHEDDPGADDDGAARGVAGAGNAVFTLVHVEDRAAEGQEGEALVLVPSRMLALLVPFDGLGVFAGLIGEAFGDEPLPECAVCGAAVPGGTLGAPNRAARRRAVRGRASQDGRDGGRRAA